MGQQQLFLVLLVVVLVGVATIVAINTFGESTTNANREAVRQDLYSGAVNADMIFEKPLMFDGADGDFTQVKDHLLRRLLISITPVDEQDDVWRNENGIYKIDNLEKRSVTIRAQPASGGPDILAHIKKPEEQNDWVVNILDDEQQ